MADEIDAEPISEKNGLSIFDLDNTLLNCTLSYRFFSYLLRKKVYSLKNLLQVLHIGALYKLGRLPISKVHEKVSSLFLESTSASLIIEHFKQFHAQFSLRWINKKVLHALDEAKRMGHYTLLATSSPDFLVRPLLNYFPVDELFASQYHRNDVSDRLYCREAIDGERKKNRSLAISEKFNLPKQLLYAYSDSITDLPLLECVGNPIVVRPDRKLKKIASERRWKRI